MSTFDPAMTEQMLTGVPPRRPCRCLNAWLSLLPKKCAFGDLKLSNTPPITTSGMSIKSGKYAGARSILAYVPVIDFIVCTVFARGLFLGAP